MSKLIMKGPASGSAKTPSFERTWGSSASSGYCSGEETESEFEQYFTARTSFGRKPLVEKKKEEVRTDSF